MNIEVWSLEDLKCRQSGEKEDVVFAVSWIQIQFVRPGFLVPYFLGKFRAFPGCMKIMIACNDDIAFLPEQCQAGWCISRVPILVKRQAET